mgnify:CR=1 FL=1
MSLTKADLRAGASSYHYRALVDAADHVGGFDECPDERCAAMRAYLDAHAFVASAPPYICEKCEGTWDDLDAALAVRCVG